MPKFNHAFDFAFEVITEKEDPNEITEAELFAAIRARIDRIEAAKGAGGETMHNACDCYDTHEEE
jgi:hypothetical protein